jgi:hypothetical protein
MQSTQSARFSAKGLICSILSAATVALLPSTVSAEGTFIPAPNRVDMVADSPRNLLYITSGDSVLRYDLTNGTFLSPFVLGGVLKGIDLSPNGDTLLVADKSTASGNVWVHVVDLVSGASRKASVPAAFMESGTYTVAFGNDGNALVSSTFAGSGSVPVRKYSPALDQWTQISTINMNSMLTASGDGSTVGVAESNSSGGPFGRYRVSDGNFLRKWPSGTGWSNFEIGTNHNGTQFALPTYGGTFIYDAALNKIATLGTYAGRLPIGVVYHPVENIVYFAWTQGQEVIAHDTTTFATLATFNVEHTFGWLGNSAFQQGRLRISRDGSQLFATVAGGVRFLQQYASLDASLASVATDEDGALPIALTASIGNGGTLAYSILAEPAHGTLTGTAPNLVYTPNPDFSGADEFTFAADYGLAGAQATISIAVSPVNDAPAVSNQTLAAAEDTARNVTLTAVDPDNTQLSYAIVEAPSHGTLTGSAPNLTYTPSANYNGADSFRFQASDGTANSQIAVVSFNIVPVNDPPVAVGATLTTSEESAVPVALAASDIDSENLDFNIVAGPAHGTLTGGAPNLIYTPAANYSGPDSFTFQASDGFAASNNATVSIAVTAINDPPVAVSATLTTSEDTTAPVALAASDIDSGNLTFNIVAGPAHGTLTGVAPNLVYTPAANYSGPDSFSFQASDGMVASNNATVSIAVTAINDPPVAVGATLTTSEDTAAPVALAASDIDSGNLTFNIVAGPAHGTLTGVAPNLVYKPAANYSGPDSFSFQASDGAAASNNATVSIAVTAVNDAPIAVADSTTTKKNTLVNIAVLANDSDVDGGALVINSATQGSKGSTAIINGGTAIRYTPTRNITGTDTFTYGISDGNGGTATATVTVVILK